MKTLSRELPVVIWIQSRRKAQQLPPERHKSGSSGLRLSYAVSCCRVLLYEFTRRERVYSELSGWPALFLRLHFFHVSHFFCAYILSMLPSFLHLHSFCVSVFLCFRLSVFPSFGVCFFDAYLLSFAFFLLSCRANIPASSVPEIECQVQETAQMIADSGVEAN